MKGIGSILFACFLSIQGIFFLVAGFVVLSYTGIVLLTCSWGFAIWGFRNCMKKEPEDTKKMEGIAE